ncbi:MAG: signal peptidase I [Candidatus Kapabacteria bacterium]|nr:signal peptidase I [Candidatus Kapabacteria bacterium]
MTLARDILSSAIAAIVVALLLRFFVVGAFRIPSHSMEQTLLVGDHILVSKIAYLLRDVRRGDVVVFTLPDDIPGVTAGQPLIKRVVAIEGDTLRMTATSIIVNGIRQPAPPQSASPGPLRADANGFVEEVIIPRGHVFVIGDNRANSNDSRMWGPLDRERIIGTPLFVYWSYGPDDINPEPHLRFDRFLDMIR